MTPGSGSRRATAPAWVRAVDGAMEGGALAFAAWTLFYELALVTQWTLWWPARVWVVLAAGLLGWRAYVGVHRGPDAGEPVEPGEPVGTLDPAPGPSLKQAWFAVTAVVVLVLLGALRGVIGYLPVLLVGLVLIVSTLMQARSRRALVVVTRGPGRVPPGAHLVAGAVCIALAVLASALWGSSGDDIYYVNRAAWVAEHGTAVSADTMFSSGQLASTYLALPLASIEAWQGAMAHILSLPAATFTFIWIVPFLGAATGWATWRLVRTWAPRRATLVFLLATMFTLFSAHTAVGRYSLGVIWEGKIPAVTIVVPLAWHCLTRVMSRPRRDDLLHLVALGICFVGLTSGAPLIASAMAAAGLLAAWLLRSRAGAVGAGCFLLAPLLAGIAQALGSGLGVGPAQLVFRGSQVFDRLFGSGAPMLLGLVGVVLGVRLLQGPARTVAACASLAGLSSFLPGVPELVDAVTGSGPVAWRLLYVIPTAVLVGMLATVRLPHIPVLARHKRVLEPTAAITVSAVVVVVLVAQGTALWSPSSGTKLVFGRWAVDQAALRDVRAVEDLKTPPGPWLLPQIPMGVFAITTTRHPTVVSRYAYLLTLRTSRSDLADRETLLRLVNAHVVSPPSVRQALRRLEVSLACVPSGSKRAVGELQKAVGAPLERHGTLACHVGLVDSSGA